MSTGRVFLFGAERRMVSACRRRAGRTEGAGAVATGAAEMAWQVVAPSDPARAWHRRVQWSPLHAVGGCVAFGLAAIVR